MSIGRLITLLLILTDTYVIAQSIDSTLLYRQGLPFGTLDLRLATSHDHFYYLAEGQTFSYRKENGIPTKTFRDMTSWDSSPYLQGHLRMKDGSSDQFVMNYRLLLPKDYDPAGATEYPLVIMLHGRMESANCADNDCHHANVSYDPNVNQPPAPTDVNHQLLNNDYNLNHAGLAYLEARNASTVGGAEETRSFPGFVLFPQNLNGWDGKSAEDAIRIIRLLLKKYNVDEDRIYLNGISNGGYGAYEALKRAPWMFAAAILFSAANEAAIIKEKLTPTIAQVPLWIFQGATDPHPTVDQTENYIREFRKHGAVVRYTLYPNLGHGTWNAGLSEPDFFQWMLSRRRNDVHAFGGSAGICPTSNKGVRLSSRPGFAFYEWRHNGNILSSSNEASIEVLQPGKYGVRFRDDAGIWSQWSAPIDVYNAQPPDVSISVNGSRYLPDANGSNETLLESSTVNDQYQWFRNGSLIRSAQEKKLLISTGGQYQLSVAGFDGCASVLSAVVNVIAKNATLSSPENFKGTAISASEVSLSWTPVGSDVRFEIWRRIEDKEGAQWKLVTEEPVAGSSMVDSGLLPRTSYQYLVRAVNEQDHSAFSGTSPVLTPADEEPPGIPSSLTAKKVRLSAIKLSWQAAKDNAAVKDYIVQINDDTVSTITADTTVTIDTLTLNSEYIISVRARDFGGNTGASSNMVKVDTYVTGLYYEHSTGAWSSVRDIDWSKPEFTGVTNEVNLKMKTQDDFYNLRLSGYVFIESPGVYQFRTYSNDGSRLLMNDSVLVDNDGIHELTEVTSSVYQMSHGPHQLVIEFFDYALEDSLYVTFKGPDTGNEWIPMTGEHFKSSPEALSRNDSDISVYPNPASGYFKVGLDGDVTSPAYYTILIHDHLGALRHQQTLDQLSDAINVPETIASGIYFVTLLTGKEKYTRKISIVR